MIAEKEKAAASTAARTTKQHCETYTKASPQSSLKEHIGQLLLLLLTKKVPPDGWRQLEGLLHQFYEGGVL